MNLGLCKEPLFQLLEASGLATYSVVITPPKPLILDNPASVHIGDLAAANLPMKDNILLSHPVPLPTIPTDFGEHFSKGSIH